MSAGPGDKSRIYKTSDAGEHWTLQFTNPDPKGFFDAIAFWDAQHGIVVGDQLDGRAEVLTTDDGGASWQRRSPPPGAAQRGLVRRQQHLPHPAWASATRGSAPGGPGAARVFHSTDRGRTWTVATTPMRNDGAAAGIFSLAFADARHGIAVGGDYSKDKEDRQNIALTSDGGVTWTAPPGAGPTGLPFRRRLAARPQALDRHRHLRIRRLHRRRKDLEALRVAAPTTP